MPFKLSIIIPTWNESSSIVASLQPLQLLRAQGHQIIVVDGGSSDNTKQLAQPLADIVELSASGRAHQMNAG
jgi:glycosyltransferase involved in cell wall biosynthesis